MELNNATTIATWTGILVFLIEVICKHFGIEIPHDTIVMFVTGLVTFIIAIISSKHPNSFDWLGNGTEPTGNIEYNGDIYDNDSPLNSEYECDEDDGC